MENKIDFEKVYSIDVNKYTEKKNGLTYLSWANAWSEFMKIYPNAKYTIKKDDKGLCYFGDERVGYMVYTTVEVSDLIHEMWLPVMDNVNNAMKLEKYTYTTKYGEKTVDAMTMFDVNKTIMRCLVKNLAMFGLGLYIYAGEDLPNDEKTENKPVKTSDTTTTYTQEKKPASKEKLAVNDPCPDCDNPVIVLEYFNKKTNSGAPYWKCKKCGLAGFSVKPTIVEEDVEIPF